MHKETALCRKRSVVSDVLECAHRFTLVLGHSMSSMIVSLGAPFRSSASDDH